MKVSEFLTQVNYAYRGIDDDTPTVGSEEANQWVATLNRKKNELYSNARVLWSDTFAVTPPNEAGTVATAGTTTLTGTNTFFTDYRAGDTITVDGETVRTIDTITSDTSLTVTVAFSNTASAKTFTRATIVAAAVDEYSLNRAFIAAANRAYVLTTDSKKVYVDYLDPRRSMTDARRVYVAGVNPKRLTYTSTIASTENIVGGTLLTPGYYMPEDVSSTNADAQLPLPDPYWGVMSVAAELAFNDITYEDKAQDLNAKANAIYLQMLRNNRRNTYNSPKATPTNVNRIRGY